MESIKKMLEQAQNEFDPSQKRNLLNKVLSIEPENPEALKALLYLGRLGEKGVKTGDYSAIRSYCLNIFDQPENYRPEDVSSVRVGLVVRFADTETLITNIEKDEEGTYICTLLAKDAHVDGFYDGVVVVESYKPMSFVLN